MFKVTIGIPVYNDSKNILTCLESIKNQTIGFENIEIICVDDGSTDDTARIIKKFTKKNHINHNIVYLHQKNTGTPGAARNRIIDISRGEYIYFVDGDDYLGEDAVKKMYEIGIENNSDVILGKFVGVNRKVPVVLFKETQPKINLFNSIIIDSLNVLKMFKTSYVRELDIRFNPEIKMAEDHSVSMKAYLHTDSIAVMADCDCYFWVRHINTDSKSHLTGGILPVEEFYKYFYETLEVINTANIDEESRTKAFSIYWHRLLSLDIITEFNRKRDHFDKEKSFVYLKDIASKYMSEDILLLLNKKDFFLMKLILNGNYELLTSYLKVR